MAFVKTAGCLILAGAMYASAAQFEVRHKHFKGGCYGVMTVDEKGLRFTGPNGHEWSWSYPDIQQLTLASGRIRVLTYQDQKLLLGRDREFEFTGRIPTGQLAEFLRGRMDQRFVEAVAQPERPATGVPDLPVWSIPVKHLRTISGSQGTLSFGADTIIYASENDSRAWRYSDIRSISSSGPFQLSIVTLEKGFDFQLKQPITEARYNELWLQIERKNGRIQ
jgi:hypothetical protein